VAVRAAAGFGASIAIVILARRRRALSASGALAAVVVGTIITAAGWRWSILLIAFFLSASILSRLEEDRKEESLGEVEKGRERDAWQVLANGGVFAMIAIASLIHPSNAWLPIAAGSISASTADTWATEIGTLSKRPPKSITSRLVVPPGTSGGVTWLGTVAALAGAATIALCAMILGWGSKVALAALVGGLSGAIVDSIAGATIQRQQWCDRCNKSTERTVHRCGTTTRPAGGVRWINNDAVNAISSVAGAVAGSAFLLQA
jgi:uncharacterized protein (TIGR00297 family)